MLKLNKNPRTLQENRNPGTCQFTDWVTLIPTTRSKSFVLLRSLQSFSLHAHLGATLQLLSIQS